MMQEHQAPLTGWTRFVAIVVGVAVLALALPVAVQGQERPAGSQPTAASKPANAAIYDENADAKKDIAAAMARAKKDNKRVLLMFGGNWCGWCRKLHGLFGSDPDVSRALLYEYELVMVDIGRWDKNQDVAKEYGAPKSAGVPFLIVLDYDGRVLARQETGVLEEGDGHSPEKVLTFLNAYKASPLDAVVLFDDARRQAEQDGRLLMVRFVTPWCGWCHELDLFLDRPEIQEMLSKDLLLVKLDVDRMSGGNEIFQRYHGSGRGGVPWFAFIDARGTKLDTSEGPRGNVGYPMEPHEIEQFVSLMKKHAKKLDADGLKQLESLLVENARRLKAAHP